MIARHYHSGDLVRIERGQGRIAALDLVHSPPCPPSTFPWIAPALVDLQVNGFAGVDFQADNLSAGDLRRAVTALEYWGCTRCFATLITAPWERLIQRVQGLARLRTTTPELAEAIAGLHVEGPFLSPEAGYAGAHDPAYMLDPTVGRLAQLWGAAGEAKTLITLAPERPGSEAAIRAAVTRGTAVNLGHTNAAGLELARAIAAGAGAFTHLGNACPQHLDRHDNILWRVIDEAMRPRAHTEASFRVSVIPDGVHVSPPLFRILHRLLPHGSIYYVSDAMAAAGAPPGQYSLGNLSLEVGVDRVVRQPGRSNLAGSALTPLEGVFRAATMLEQPWQRCWDAFSVVPARRLGWTWGIEVGAPADYCLLDWPGPTADVLPCVAATLTGLRLRVFRGGKQVQECIPHGAHGET